MILILLFTGLNQYGFDVKKTLNELIEEDFTSRTFDNVKAASLMVQSIIEVVRYDETLGKEDEGELVARHMAEFFKLRNK